MNNRPMETLIGQVDGRPTDTCLGQVKGYCYGAGTALHAVYLLLSKSPMFLYLYSRYSISIYAYLDLSIMRVSIPLYAYLDLEGAGCAVVKQREPVPLRVIRAVITAWGTQRTGRGRACEECTKCMQVQK